MISSTAENKTPVRKPLPKLWPYDINDIKTWKYIDLIIGMSYDKKGKKIKCVVKRWVKNPEFAYDHLDTFGG